MSGSLTYGDGENVPGIPGACAPAILRIWQEAHGTHGRTPRLCDLQMNCADLTSRKGLRIWDAIMATRMTCAIVSPCIYHTCLLTNTVHFHATPPIPGTPPHHDKDRDKYALYMNPLRAIPIELYIFKQTRHGAINKWKYIPRYWPFCEKNSPSQILLTLVPLTSTKIQVSITHMQYHQRKCHVTAYL